MARVLILNMQFAMPFQNAGSARVAVKRVKPVASATVSEARGGDQ
jgi:hypothetical protein